MSPKHFLNFKKITKQEFVSIIDRGLELKKSIKPKKTLKIKEIMIHLWKREIGLTLQINIY